MQKFSVIFFLVFLNVLLSFAAVAQKDSIYSKISIQKDSVPNKPVISKKEARKNWYLDTVNKFNPHIAVIRSAIIPGWGQAYNHQYWKIPIIYGALGTTAGIFFYNLTTYRQLRAAYAIRLSGDTASFSEVAPYLLNISTPAIQSYRNLFRQDIDYSVLFFLIFWGVNVVDATVSAHLKTFDISDDLSIDVKPSFTPNYNTSGITGGISLVFNIGKNNSKQLPSPPK